ncbi:MAG: hypothetical protein FWH18_04085 [Marinilabiliaceae bacterium]|nr:hypothetical protein [Marinilabiliaceae bacterium]
MKRIIIFLSLGVFLNISLFAQSIVFYRNGQPLPNNAQVVITEVDEDEWGRATMESGVYVNNTTSSTLSIELVQTVLESPSSGEFEVCMGGSCFAPGLNDATYPGTLSPGIEEVPLFHILFRPIVEDYTSAKVQYEIYPIDSPGDKSTVTIIYNYWKAGIDKITNNDNISIFKQNGQIFFRFDKISPNMQLFIYNIAGVEVGQYDIKSEIVAVQDNLSKGVYIYAVKEKGKVVHSGKYTNK